MKSKLMICVNEVDRYWQIDLRVTRTEIGEMHASSFSVPTVN